MSTNVEKSPDRQSNWKELWGSDEWQAWSNILRNPFNNKTLQKWWKSVFEGTGWSSQGQKIQRKAAWFVTEGCSCEYRYSGTVWNPSVFPPWLKDITLQVMKKVGWPRWIRTLPNSCNINLYENGNNYVQWHSDDEPLFNGLAENCTIISLSLGASRTFQIKMKKGGRGRIVSSTVLDDGDILTMEGMFQKYLKHRLKRDRRVLNSRINITWRWIKNHDKDTCPL